MDTDTKERLISSILHQNPSLMYEALSPSPFRTTHKKNYIHLLLVHVYPSQEDRKAYRYIWDKDRLQSMEIVDLLELGRYIEQYKKHKDANIF